MELIAWFAVDALAWAIEKPARLIVALLFGALAAVGSVAIFVG